MKAGLSKKRNGSISEPSIYFRPILHSDSLPVPIPPQKYKLEIENKDSMEKEVPNKSSTFSDLDYEEKDDQRPD